MSDIEKRLNNIEAHLSLRFLNIMTQKELLMIFLKSQDLSVLHT